MYLLMLFVSFFRLKNSVFPPKKDDKLAKTKTLLESTKALSISMKHKMNSSQSAVAKTKMADKVEVPVIKPSKRKVIVTSKALPQRILPKPAQLEFVKSQTIDTSTSPMLFPDSPQNSTAQLTDSMAKPTPNSPIMQVKITSPKLQPRNSPRPGTRTSPRLRAISANIQSSRASPRLGPYSKIKPASPLSLSPQVYKLFQAHFLQMLEFYVRRDGILLIKAK